jgi:hypothetical protein
MNTHYRLTVLLITLIWIGLSFCCLWPTVTNWLAPGEERAAAPAPTTPSSSPEATRAPTATRRPIPTPAPVTPTPQPSPTPAPAGNATVNTEFVNLRTGPSTDHPIAEPPETGSIVFPVYARTSDGAWLQLNPEGSLWVFAELALVDVPIDTIPVNENPASP